VLIGEPGVGKTPLLRSRAAHRDGEVPSFLADKKVSSRPFIDCCEPSIVASLKNASRPYERVDENQNSIVFMMSCIRWLVLALPRVRSMQPTFSSPRSPCEIQCIGATTPGEYRKSIEKDRSLERRFQAVKVRHQ